MRKVEDGRAHGHAPLRRTPLGPAGVGVGLALPTSGPAKCGDGKPSPYDGAIIDRTKSISGPIYADFCIYVSKRDSGRPFFHIVKVFQNFISFRYKQIRKFFSVFALFPIFSFPCGRLLLWSKKCELRRYTLCGVRD
jgi:hypothetical protein